MFNDSPHLSLTIRFSDNDICFSAYDKKQPDSFLFERFPLRNKLYTLNEFIQIYNQEPITALNYENVEILCHTPITLIPIADFQEEDSQTLHNFCFPNQAPQKVFYDMVGSLGTTILYSIDQSLSQEIKNKYPNAHFTSTFTPLLKRISQKGLDQTTRKRIFCNLENKETDIIAFSGRRLLLCNSFMTTNIDDCAFYTFNISQKINFDPCSDEIYIIGRSPELEDTYNFFEQFADNIFAISPSGDFNRHKISRTPNVPYDLMSYYI